MMMMMMTTMNWLSRFGRPSRRGTGHFSGAVGAVLRAGRSWSASAWHDCSRWRRTSTRCRRRRWWGWSCRRSSASPTHRDRGSASRGTTGCSRPRWDCTPSSWNCGQLQESAMTRRRRTGATTCLPRRYSAANDIVAAAK